MRLAVAGCLLLGGCAVAGDAAGFIAGGAAGSATANPAIGFAVGVGVKAGVDELQRYVTRRRWGGEQDAIATAAGDAPLNKPRTWEIRHTIPIGNEHGQLEAVREFATPVATCRQVVFSVADDTPALFSTTLCRQAKGWVWAAAEPAVDRWGSLQ